MAQNQLAQYNPNTNFDLESDVTERTFNYKLSVKGSTQNVSVKMKRSVNSSSVKAIYELSISNLPNANNLIINDQNANALQEMLALYRTPPF